MLNALGSCLANGALNIPGIALVDDKW